jgi:hypothetical protein
VWGFATTYHPPLSLEEDTMGPSHAASRVGAARRDRPSFDEMRPAEGVLLGFVGSQAAVLESRGSHPRGVPVDGWGESSDAPRKASARTGA